MERRAERQVSAMFIIAALLAVAFCVCYFAIDPTATLFGYGAQNLAFGLTLGLSLLLIGVGAEPVGQEADERRGDHRAPPLGRLFARRTVRSRWKASPPGSRSPASVVVPSCATA